MTIQEMTAWAQRTVDAQRLFESLFPAGHTPKIDTRTPAQVKNQAESEHWT